MPLSFALATFFLIWWIVLFAVLPWGVRSQHEAGDIIPGTDPGAPVLPNLSRKLVWTTLATAVIFAAFYIVYVYHLVTIDELLTPFGFSPIG
jgi:predicted secreted protein